MIIRPDIKVCGMTQLENIEQIEGLQPAYLGFIFYDKSPRNVSLNELPPKQNAKRVGVFVNANISTIEQKIEAFSLDVIQLHGDESPLFCKQLKQAQPNAIIWKAFGIKDTFNFAGLRDFEPYIDAFLFDTKTQLRGGSGKVFDWRILNNYSLKTPIVISGGIGLEQIKALKELLQTELPITTIDLNSKFEVTPGIKNYDLLKQFFDAI